jgi:hypothetical protein
MNLELIGLIISASINIVAFSIILYLRKFIIKSASIMEQSDIDILLLSRQLEHELNQKEAASIEQTDGFLKFVSESRDWAFKYIEDVQKAIAEFSVYEKDLVIGNNSSKVVEAYSNLKKFLPDEGTTNKEIK